MMAPGWPASQNFLREQVIEALTGVGDATRGEWHEWSGRAYHLRRRLSADEQAQVGDAVDVRGTPEETRRLAAARAYLPMWMRRERIGGTGASQ